MVRRAFSCSRAGWLRERDHRAGYLFGEILNCYHFQPDFSQFMDDFSPNAKVAVTRVRPTF
jgi:hypothetical protein